MMNRRHREDVLVRRSVTVERDLRAMERPSDHTAVTAELEF